MTLKVDTSAAWLAGNFQCLVKGTCLLILTKEQRGSRVLFGDLQKEGQEGPIKGADNLDCFPVHDCQPL